MIGEVMEVTESVLRAGYRLDRYELLCPIASGGMATVWLARLRGKRGFEKLFAIKTIRTELVDDARFQEMFLDEARIASGIQHPNVAQILDLGEQDDVLFIVMEWVDGDSLAKIRRLLAKRDATLPVGIVLRVLSDACGGLHAAHELRDERGEPLEIVHRDVSPHNILLANSGAAKVIDFGIAKAQNRRQGETRTGIVKGKIQYMAPEQVKKGAPVDRRADVWALGMCLHELVMGRLPYDGEDDVGVIRRLMADEAPAIASDVPTEIARVLARSMVLDPDARFPTAAGMQRALEGAMKELGASASSEDVAAFARSELPELGRRRREAVGKAIEEARERGTPVTDARDEVAFAPTEVGARDAREEVRPIALTKRKRAPPTRRGAGEDSHVTPSAALEQEPIAIPKRGSSWLWGVLLLALGGLSAVIVWPASGRVLTALGWGASSNLGPQQAPSPSPMAPHPTTPTTTPASAAAAVAPPSPAATTADPALADSTSPLRPSLDPPPSRVPPLHAATVPGGASEAAEASVPVESPSAATATGPTPAGPTPTPTSTTTETEDDPNNPYNN
jgi:eukaryotic-like serine/threonine-protein kinase